MAAQARYEGTIVRLLEKESLDDILKKYFDGYQIWRKQVMGIDEPFMPTVEDLWVMFLSDADNGFFNADVPDVLNYLTHKVIEARQQDGSAADIGGFLKKEYTRWHNIIELQSTSFQSPAAGAIRNVVPYDYYLKKADIEDLFRTRGFIEWYDALGLTLDGNPDLRDAIYQDFISSLEQKRNALKQAVETLVDKKGNDILRLKKLLASIPEYKDYVNFFRSVEKGEYQVSGSF